MLSTPQMWRRETDRTQPGDVVAKMRVRNQRILPGTQDGMDGACSIAARGGPFSKAYSSTFARAKQWVAGISFSPLSFPLWNGTPAQALRSASPVQSTYAASAVGGQAGLVGNSTIIVDVVFFAFDSGEMRMETDRCARIGHQGVIDPFEAFRIDRHPVEGLFFYMRHPFRAGAEDFLRKPAIYDLFPTIRKGVTYARTRNRGAHASLMSRWPQ